jgi:hypothetical protein
MPADTSTFSESKGFSAKNFVKTDLGIARSMTVGCLTKKLGFVEYKI